MAPPWLFLANMFSTSFTFRIAYHAYSWASLIKESEIFLSKAGYTLPNITLFLIKKDVPFMYIAVHWYILHGLDSLIALF